MIIQEETQINNKTLIKTYSNDNKYIIQNETNHKYVEAIDIPNKFTYRESDETIEEINKEK